MNTRPTEAIDNLNMALMNIPVKYKEEDFPTRAEYLAYKEGHKEARHAAVDVVLAQARASQPEGATLASQEDITGTSQEETTEANQTAEEVSEAFFAQERTIHRLEDEIADLRAQLAATTENLQTAVRQAWEANAELSKLRAVPGDSGFRKALEDILAMRGKGDCASDLIDIADSALAGLYAAPVAAVPPSDAKGATLECTPEAQEVLADIFTNSERPDKMFVTFDVGNSVMVRYDDLDEEWCAELRAAMAAVGAAGQEAANAKDAARPIPDAECAQGSCARGKDGCRGRCCLAGHKLPIVADIDSAAMAAAPSSEKGGDK